VAADPRAAAAAARVAARTLARLDGDARAAAVDAIAGALLRHADAIVAANALDLAAARSQLAAGLMTPALLQRLEMSRGKLESVAEGVRQVAAMPDPAGRVTLATLLDDGLLLERVTCPVGVLAVIVEARPDALPQIVALALRAGNAVLLKAGSEAQRTSRAIFAAVHDALDGTAVPASAVALLEGREAVTALLGAERDVDLVIPRGSADLVRHVQANTRIPVLGHADGRCHLYVDRAADLGRALAIAVDAKVQYPAACNSIETVLVHADVAAVFVPAVVGALRERKVEVRGDAAACRLAGDLVRPAAAADWDTEYGDLIVNLGVVPDMDAAIAHIAAHGSRHTEAIVTTDEAAAARFTDEVDAAGVFVNASTRFADGFRYGFGAEVGISTGKLHPRGPVGLDGLVTYKYRLTGNGHVVADYVGRGGRKFLHRTLTTDLTTESTGIR
jgi:glutamate-5-semialdehyde dehydrogenase